MVGFVLVVFSDLIITYLQNYEQYNTRQNDFFPGRLDGNGWPQAARLVYAEGEQFYQREIIVKQS